MDNQTQEQFWQEMFSRVANFPYSWIGKATEMLDAANLALVRESEERILSFFTIFSFSFKTPFFNTPTEIHLSHFCPNS